MRKKKKDRDNEYMKERKTKKNDKKNDEIQK